MTYSSYLGGQNRETPMIKGKWELSLIAGSTWKSSNSLRICIEFGTKWNSGSMRQKLRWHTKLDGTDFEPIV